MTFHSAPAFKGSGHPNRRPALVARAEHQRKLAALSSKGRQLIASRSGHFPQFTEPAMVVEAVRAAISLTASEHA